MIADLVAAKQAADQALADAQTGANLAYQSALDAYRAKPTAEARAAYQQAAANLAHLRNALNAGRPGVTIGGNATTTEV